MPSKIPQQDFQRALSALGIEPSDIDAIRRASFQKAQELLQELKTRAGRNYRKLALELHPDRTQGDKSKEELFVLLGRVLEEFNKTTVQPAPPPPPQITFIPVAPVWQGFQTTTPTSTVTFTTGFSPGQVYRFVTMRPR